jgi:16S rRNA (cytosine1402-N4)-methyltransferase
VHESVLLAETIELLNIRPTGVYIDCTYGRGGHTREVLKKLGSGGRLLALDRDPEAIESGHKTLSDARLELVHERFSRVGQLLQQRQLGEQVDGILMDLGVSSPQLDKAARGFSFRTSGPLDMRMDPTTGPTASEWLAGASEKELRECLWELGEERYARRIARKIAQVRSHDPIATTLQLATVIKEAVPRGNYRIDPATRTFQAIRLKINSELEELSEGLRHAADNLNTGGRVVVLAFHSLEDRIVKRFFRDLCRPVDPYSSKSDGPRFQLQTKKPIRPGDAEREQNPRARSARLRVLERVA